ncbi:YpeB-like protein with putative protease inhibitory function [Nitrosomonas nitrosa]|uniref:Peptidase propeptide and YPEB domain-containing protein n=1 Tax=Nitrosomonas nitrosa TaxID=52442 RepID=A0A8H8Z1C9_9PROT|nr:PepSY domain-containing protein [Nitrosomonas nitrosa]PTQ91623.1 YpeB-like protein with putative protease inhibitory function [Nitrosomonas nitrosa]CAE6508675.1 Peptidase propeptide and YPEB domain-containing protein [Nitrosomonas nitrosa]
MNIKLNVIITLIALFLSTSSFAGLFDEEKVEWSQVPEKVQQTINQHLQGGTIEKIEKETKKKKVIVYEAYVKKPDGEKIEIKVEEDGTLLEIEDEND